MENAGRSPMMPLQKLKAAPLHNYVPRTPIRRERPVGIDYRGVLDAVSVGIAEIGADGRIYFANSFFCRMLGYDDDEMIGGKLSFHDLIHHEDLDHKVVTRQRLRAGNVPHYAIEARYRRKNGSIVWTRTTTKLIGGESRYPRALKIVEDITREKLLCQQLKFVEGIKSVATWDWNVQGDLVVCSAAFEELFRLLPSAPPPSFGELLDRVYSDDRGAVATAFKIAGQTGYCVTQFRIVRPCGEIRSVKASIAILRNPTGGITNYVGSMVDITTDDGSLTSAQQERPDGVPATSPVTVGAASNRPGPGRKAADVERELILETLERCFGNRTHAAIAVGISIRTLRNKLKAYAADGLRIAPARSGKADGLERPV